MSTTIFLFQRSFILEVIHLLFPLRLRPKKQSKNLIVIDCYYGITPIQNFGSFFMFLEQNLLVFFFLKYVFSLTPVRCNSHHSHSPPHKCYSYNIRSIELSIRNGYKLVLGKGRLVKNEIYRGPITIFLESEFRLRPFLFPNNFLKV